MRCVGRGGRGGGAFVAVKLVSEERLQLVEVGASTIDGVRRPCQQKVTITLHKTVLYSKGERSW